MTPRSRLSELTPKETLNELRDLIDAIEFSLVDIGDPHCSSESAKAAKAAAGDIARIATDLATDQIDLWHLDAGTDRRTALKEAAADAEYELRKERELFE